MTLQSGEKICDEAEVILEAKRVQEREHGRGFRHDAEVRDETGRNSEKADEKTVNVRPGQQNLKQELPEQLGHGARFDSGKWVDDGDE